MVAMPSVPRVLFVLLSCQLAFTQQSGAAEAADPYDVLYDVIMTRYGPDGKTYGKNEVTPLIFANSAFPFDDESYRKFTAALDAFGALPQQKVEAYSDVKRALLQRHLWKVFDATGPGRVVRSHLANRTDAQKKLASLIQRLALTKREILALPDVGAATAKSGDFPQHYDRKAPFGPFFPADLYAKESSWVCLGKVDHPIPAIHHSFFVDCRSAFIAFMRVPAARKETLAYVEKLNTDVFPVGTQFALVEQAFVISDKGEMVLSPLVPNIQLRAHLIVDFNLPRDSLSPATQCVAEFAMQPRHLMSGKAVMRAIGPIESRVKSLNLKQDPFEGPAFLALDEEPRLRSCVRCHGAPGLKSVRSRTPRAKFKEGSPTEIGQATVAQKRDDFTWKLLQRLWRREANDEPPENQSEEN